MNRYPAWQYDEFRQIGTDYGSLAEVEAYDARHAKFRNVEKENDAVLEALRTRPEDSIIEFGTGTGAFAIQAARKCARVYAVDVSLVMLDYAKTKAARVGVSNIDFHHGAFLTYSHADPPVDAIVTSTAFHHLPDFWKGIALRRLHAMLKSGGRLFISDVIFAYDKVRENIDQWIANLVQAAGPGIRKEIEDHIRLEYSTYDWIMEGLLERAGFRIIDKRMQDGVIGRYLCRKESNEGGFP
jgi:putative AdoMet-dependent methyltransferase